MGYIEGVESGRRSGGNPFTAIISGINDAQARRYSEDKKRREEERALKDALVQLGMKAEYDRVLNEEKATAEHKKAVEIEQLKQRGELTKERFKAREKIKGTEGILKQMGLISSEDNGERKNLEEISSRIPEGVSIDIGEGIKISGKQSAEEKGREKSVEEAFTRGEGVKRAAKRLASITRQFNEALPSTQRGVTTTSQRVSGMLAVIGAKTGTKPNPKLLALKDTAKLQLRGILRDMGEGARMSDQDITQNLAVIEQEGLSNEERKAKVASFLQVAIDSMDENLLEVLKKDRTTIELFKEFGVDVQNLNINQTSTGLKYTVEQ